MNDKVKWMWPLKVRDTIAVSLLFRTAAVFSYDCPTPLCLTGLRLPRIGFHCSVPEATKKTIISGWSGWPLQDNSGCSQDASLESSDRIEPAFTHLKSSTFLRPYTKFWPDFNLESSSFKWSVFECEYDICLWNICKSNRNLNQLDILPDKVELECSYTTFWLKDFSRMIRIGIFKRGE